MLSLVSHSRVSDETCTEFPELTVYPRLPKGSCRLSTISRFPGCHKLQLMRLAKSLTSSVITSKSPMRFSIACLPWKRHFDCAIYILRARNICTLTFPIYRNCKLISCIRWYPLPREYVYTEIVSFIYQPPTSVLPLLISVFTC